MPPGPPYNVELGCGLGGLVLFQLSFSLRNFNFFHGNINYTTSFCSLFVGPASKSEVWSGRVSCYTTMSGTILSKSLSHFIVLAPFISSSGWCSRRASLMIVKTWPPPSETTPRFGGQKDPKRSGDSSLPSSASGLAARLRRASPSLLSSASGLAPLEDGGSEDGGWRIGE